MSEENKIKAEKSTTLTTLAGIPVADNQKRRSSERFGCLR
jgi:hypothetical protein